MTFNENLEWFAAAPSSGIDSAIVGGSLAEEYEFPYVASFQRRGLFGFIHSCGAVIYNQRWVLVAAQCVDNIADVELTRVVAGEYSFEATTGYEQVRGIKTIVQNPRYNVQTLEADLAMLELNNDFDFLYPYNGTISGAPLPKIVGQDYAPGANVTSIGWGAITSPGVPADTLHKASMTIYSDSDCRTAYGFEDVIIPSQMCAWVEEGGTGPCNGDLGSPLILDDGTVIGLTSYIFGCGVQGQPSVFTQLSFYIDWIELIGGGALIPPFTDHRV